MTKWCLLPCVYSSEFDSLVFGEAFLCLCLHGIPSSQNKGENHITVLLELK